ICFFFFFQAEDGIRDRDVTGVQTCALPLAGELPPLPVEPSGPGRGTQRVAVIDLGLHGPVPERQGQHGLTDTARSGRLRRFVHPMGGLREIVVDPFENPSPSSSDYVEVYVGDS